jgi:hypothetical protein
MRGRLLAGFVVLALVPTGASAKVVTVRGELKPVAPSVQVVEKVRCPAGLRVTGGGVYTEGATLEDEVGDSYPRDGRDRDAKPDDGWVGSVNGGALGAAMRTYAICSDALRLSYRRVPAQPTSFGGSASSPCRAGYAPVGGGMRVKGKSVDSPLKGSIANGNVLGWDSAALGLSAPADQATGYSICSPSKKLEDVGISMNLGTKSQGRLDSQCPAGARVLSGGGNGVSAFGALEIASLLPSDGSDGDSKPDDAWTMWFNNESASETGSMNSHAMCLD